MEDKVLIKGKFGKISLNLPSVVCYIMAVVILIACFAVATAYGGDPGWAFRGMEYGYYGFFIGSGIFIFLGILLSTMPLELIVSQSKIEGKTLFGKRVDLPINQISTVGTGMFNRVTIATSSGSINFYGVLNQNEVFHTISDLLLTHQKQSKITTVKVAESSSEEIKKYKDLLDQGIINQEEFEAKKKQLLGL